MERTIREQLQERAEGAYRQFAAALIPNIDNVIGVRLPELRRMAKQIARGDWRVYLQEADADYFEEVMLQGMVIGYAKADADELLQHAAAFVPKINNWSVCDSFCSGLKFTKTNKKKVWSFIQPYLNSTDEYAIRFGVVMLLNYYIEEEYIDAIFERFNQITHEGYYVKMAVAWAISICFVKLSSPTRVYLTHNALDDVTYNKALQKITESNRVDMLTKTWIRSLKRK